MENNNKIRDFYLHASSNVISMNALNTICGNPAEKSKLVEASFYDIFNTPALVEKICSDDIISPICDSYKSARAFGLFGLLGPVFSVFENFGHPEMLPVL